MKKLHINIAKYATGEYGFFYLPDLMNLHGVSVDDLAQGRTANKPHFFHAVAIGLLPHRKAQLRRWAQRKLSPREQLSLLAKEEQNLVIDWHKGAPSRYLLVTDPCDKEVTSRIAGTFSYNDHDPLDPDAFDVECPSCGYVENTFDSDPFPRLSGPYRRCPDCEAPIRPKVAPAEDETDMAYEGEWDDYVNHLDELIEGVFNSAEHPPELLRVEVNRADWRGHSAYAECPPTGAQLAECLSVRGDFTVSNGRAFRGFNDAQGLVEPPHMTCTLSHHDVPTGSGVYIWPAWPCELQGEVIVGTSDDGLARAATTLFQGPISSHGGPFTHVSKEGFDESRNYLVMRLEALLGSHPVVTLLRNVDHTKQDAVEALRELIDMALEAA